jgi:hypothetical protein
MTHTTELYFEAHVTIEPVFEERLEQFKAICKRHGFRAAELLMKKRKEDTVERSKYDTFCTGRGKHYDDLLQRTLAVVSDAAEAGLSVWRYKIENTLIDVRTKQAA